MGLHPAIGVILQASFSEGPRSIAQGTIGIAPQTFP